eukprot:TRINITY_DN17987_c0_g1_i1.p1 TRINITY_DN17987_c0_g1~~TRINITY_DN17987_c0_g1_i1.p1  ORF type:complete len:398 (+),score=55.18 TRINITY_DN17987_c0_g1_i1:30-1223(+)
MSFNLNRSRCRSVTPEVFSGKKHVFIHMGDSTLTIVFDANTDYHTIEKSIRNEFGLQGCFSLIDADGDSVVLDGSMDPGDLWLMAAVDNLLPATKVPKKKNKKLKNFPDFSNIIIENATKLVYDVEVKTWTSSQIRVRLDPVPFASGSLRRAHLMKILDDPKETYVAKISITPDDDIDSYKYDAKIQLIAREWAKNYNLLNPPKKIEFIETFIIAMVDRDVQKTWSVEKYIQGDYRKHNNNFGYVSKEERNTPQTFSHWTYEASQRKLLICDIQGVGDLYTDPQIHTLEENKFPGKGNLGLKGIEKFLQTHSCNSICKYLGLSLINEKPLDFGTLPPQMYLPLKSITYKCVSEPSIRTENFLSKTNSNDLRLDQRNQISRLQNTKQDEVDLTCCSVS